jgi:hypothetical protein
VQEIIRRASEIRATVDEFDKGRPDRLAVLEIEVLYCRVSIRTTGPDHADIVFIPAYRMAMKGIHCFSYW